MRQSTFSLTSAEERRWRGWDGYTQLNAARPSQFRPSADEIVNLFAANLKSDRRQKELRQSDLAQATGIPQTDISQIERGNRNVTLQTLARLAIALDVDPRDLLRPRSAMGTVRREK